MSTEVEVSTNHDKDSEFSAGNYGLTLYQELDHGSNNAEISVPIAEFIDSRTELAIEIRKKALAFLKHAVQQLESELKGK